MSKDRDPWRGPQLLSPKEAAWWRSWQRQQEEAAKRWPRFTPGQIERARLELEIQRAPVPPELVRLLQSLEPPDEQSPPEQAVEQPDRPADQQEEAYWAHVTERLIERAPEQVLPEPVNSPAAEQTTEQAPTEQAPETIVGMTLEQIEKKLEGPTRPRHRPRVEFRHLKEALTDLKKEPRFKSMQPKEELAFVVTRLRDYGDKVENDKGKTMEKTISRRIDDWHKGKLTFVP
jgi:hypothetical protein